MRKDRRKDRSFKTLDDAIAFYGAFDVTAARNETEACRAAQFSLIAKNLRATKAEQLRKAARMTH